MGPNGQILALFRLEPAVGTALAVEGVKVVDVELRVGEGRCEATLGFAEKLPMTKEKLNFHS